MVEQTAPESFGFQTEAKQLLKLMIHSLYSNREIFLRELISNGSDAIDKLRFKSIAEPELLDGDTDFGITVAFDSDAKTISVTDNGIGMTREEVIAQLGTIAKSGTAEFLEQLTGDQKQDATLIGQFGVGFYSGFTVADEIEVLTRGVADPAGTRWISKGEEQFSVETVADLPRGTQVILHLSADAHEFADGFRLRSVVRRYSDHIGVPVRMLKESGGEDEPAEELEVVNSAKALWTRSRSEVTDEEYAEFYKHVSHDFDDPLSWSHNRVEGKLEYTSLLYVPKHAPFDLWNREAPRGLKLYVQRIFIMDEAEQFLPLYLRFVKGIVDSSDLPLNVSREILQQDKNVNAIRGALTKRVLNMLDTMASKEPEKYQQFSEEFGEVLKEGAGEDIANRESLCKLLRFASTRSDAGKKDVSLDVYLERKIEDQNKIYYLAADSYDNARNSPHLEIFKQRGIEVLLLFDRVDEWLMSQLSDYAETGFQDVMRSDLALPGASEDTDEEDSVDSDDNAALTERIKAVLDERVESVRPSKRLTESPACLVLDEFAMGAQMRQIMEASGQSLPQSKPHFEYNAKHPLLIRLDTEPDEERFSDLVWILLDQASLAEGGALTDSSAYVSRLNRLLLELLND
ncbi:MAG: molecular chaperone HtpG [Gammaproteobacteria bacterium]|nr:molecular chaperone HtpG [Gammaproteobacteria bacterium]